MIYRKMGKHRRKCPICGKLIEDGETVVAEVVKKEKYYPVKGIMRFSKWYFKHPACKEKLEIGEIGK